LSVDGAQVKVTPVLDELDKIGADGTLGAVVSGPVIIFENAAPVDVKAPVLFALEAAVKAAGIIWAGVSAPYVF
jgi:hypothetical protein